MYRYLIGIILSISFTITPALATTQLQPAINNTFQFIKNQGNKNANVAYYARTLDGLVFVTQKGELVYSLPKKTDSGTVSWAFKESFVSGNSLSPTTDENKLFTNKLFLGEVAPGIKIHLESKGTNVEKLFTVSPGADVSTIKASINGVDGSTIDHAGQLVLKTGIGPITFTKPVAFQIKDNKKQPVKVSYTLNNNHYGFELGEYDRNREVIIDPLLASTFIGGENTTGVVTNDYDFVNAIETVGNDVYIAGLTQSPDFPTALGFDSTYDTTSEGFILRLTNDLSTILNGTFIGNGVYDFAIDVDGTVVVAGQSYSGFPSTDGAYNYPSDFDLNGGFIARFSADLTELLAAGVVVQANSINRIGLGNGSIYFGGSTNNPNLLVTPGAIGQNCNCDPSGAFGIRPYVGYMGRVSADLSSLEVLSYLSSSPTSIKPAADSSVYISNGRIRQYDTDISSLIAEADRGGSFVFGDNEIIVAGGTKDFSFPVSSNAYDTSCGTDGVCNDSGGDSGYYIPRSDGLIFKYSMDLQTILAGTYIGGSGNDSIQSVALNDLGEIEFAGVTYSNNFPTTSDAFDSSYSGQGDAFVGRMSADLTSLEYASYYGGGSDESVSALVLDTSGATYVVGYTESSSFPTTSGAFSTTYNGGIVDGYIAKFDTGNGASNPAPNPDDNLLPIADAGNDIRVSSQQIVTLDGSASSDIDGTIVSYQWKAVKGKKINLMNSDSVIATFEAPKVRKGIKTIEFELTVTDNDGAQRSDTVVVTVQR